MWVPSPRRSGNALTSLRERPRLAVDSDDGPVKTEEELAVETTFASLFSFSYSLENWLLR